MEEHNLPGLLQDFDFFLFHCPPFPAAIAGEDGYAGDVIDELVM